MHKHSRWDDIKRRRPAPAPDVRTEIESDLELGQHIYDVRTAAGLSQRELAERIGTTRAVLAQLESGGGGGDGLDTRARIGETAAPNDR